jgi:hypothetical protein
MNRPICRQVLECAGRAQRRRRFGFSPNGPGIAEFRRAGSAESKAAWRFASRRTPKRWRVGDRHWGSGCPKDACVRSPSVHGPNACGKNERGLSMNRTSNPNDEPGDRTSGRPSSFGLQISFVIRHSTTGPNTCAQAKGLNSFWPQTIYRKTTLTLEEGDVTFARKV